MEGRLRLPAVTNRCSYFHWTGSLDVLSKNIIPTYVSNSMSHSRSLGAPMLSWSYRSQNMTTIIDAFPQAMAWDDRCVRFFDVMCDNVSNTKPLATVSRLTKPTAKVLFSPIWKIGLVLLVLTCLVIQIAIIDSLRVGSQ